METANAERSYGIKFTHVSGETLTTSLYKLNPLCFLAAVWQLVASAFPQINSEITQTVNGNCQYLSV